MTSPGTPSAPLPTVYVSGDNASLGAVQAVADHAGPVDVAVLFAAAARIVEARVVILAHTDRGQAAATVS